MSLSQNSPLRIEVSPGPNQLLAEMRCNRYNLGFLHVILSQLAPEIADNPERPRATNAAAQSEYAQLAGISLAELTAAMKPYLPIVRTFVV